MERLSLIQHILQRFGAALGAFGVVLSVTVYLVSNTSSKDLSSLWLLQESKLAITLAEREGLQYLASGKAKDLDAYNVQILKIGEHYQRLSKSFQGAEDLQPPFSELQLQSKKHFLAVNEMIVKKQSRAGKTHTYEVNPKESQQLLASIDALTSELRTHTSKHAGVGDVDLSIALWQLLFGLALSSYCLWRHQSAARDAARSYTKDVSDLKIQSILLDGILNSISEALIVVDDQGRFTRYNTAAERIIGKKLKRISSEDDAQQFGFFDLASQQQVGLVKMPFARALQGEQLEDVEYLVRNEAQPQGMYISISSRYLTGLNGQIQGALVVFRDISRRKATEKEWLAARESALETARKKSDFLAAMSHEIRTPMNGVMGMATLLADTKLNEEQSDYVGTIQHSAEALLRLINDILDHSKIEAGVVEFDKKAFDLKSLCEDVVEMFYPAVHERNVALTLELSGRDGWAFLGDAGRLRQVLINLVGNAVKFTEVGSIQLLIESAGKGLKFSVIDTGPGFNADESEFLFQKYFQTKSGMKYGGTGLGLSICNQLVELMGGKISVSSTPGKGTTFWFVIDLPIAKTDEIVAPTETRFAALFSGKVLLAEDQIINQRVAVTYLQKLGLQVDVAGNGKIAVEKALAGNYDLIFMDCQMPVMTGYEATQKLRELQGQKRTPIIALTAEGTSGERSTCLTVGMDDFLTKPLELEKLTDCLRRWLKNGPAVIDIKALEKLKSFVINDQSLTDALIEDFLKSAPALTAEMFEKAKLQDLEGITAAAHALKSCGATLGATGLAELCQKIEDATDLQQAQSLLESLPENVSRSGKELQKHQTLKAA